ncbi:MAG TPA: hypothetical protein VJ890_02120 [Vineibacter sp.]|nr:hypothetical protein [Vineibacter sp.]
MSRRNTCRRRTILHWALAGLSAGLAADGGCVMADDLTTKLLSPDFEIADVALSEAITRRDAALVARALEQSFLEMKIRAARALLDIGDRASVPPLIATLEANQVSYSDGSETKVLQQELNEVLVAALARLTGIAFGAVDPQSSTDIARVVAGAKAWAAGTSR